MNIGIITASDKGSIGERVDESGALIRTIMEAKGETVVAYTLLPDDRAKLSAELIRMADELHCDIVLTTGGTGFAPRDVTPEATLDVVDRLAPGLAEAMRAKSLAITPHAMLSRAVCGIRGKTLIINLPGSPKGVRENLEVVLPALPHAVELLRGEGRDCAMKV